VARFYSNENIPLQVVISLRRLGHDVLTSLEAGNANRAVADSEVLSYSAATARILLTQNRRHFLRLHEQRLLEHVGIILCTFDTDFEGQARRIEAAVTAESDMVNKLLRVNRPG